MKTTSRQAGWAPPEIVTVLAVTPQLEDRAFLRDIFDGSNWQLAEALGCGEALALLQNQQVPVVICDRKMPDGDWRSLLQSVQTVPCPPRLIVASRLADERFWAEVLNLGGHDVLLTPFRANEVLPVVYLAWLWWEQERARGIARAS